MKLMNTSGGWEMQIHQLGLPVGLTYDQLKKSAPYINIPCRCPFSQILKKFQAQTVLIAQTKFYDP